jgi:hypothetical protein
MALVEYFSSLQQARNEIAGSAPKPGTKFLRCAERRAVAAAGAGNTGPAALPDLVEAAGKPRAEVSGIARCVV